MELATSSSPHFVVAIPDHISEPRWFSDVTLGDTTDTTDTTVTPMLHRGGIAPSKQSARVERLVALFDAENDIAPFDDAAFGKKVGDLIARSACARKRKQLRAKVGRVDFASQGRKLTRDN